MTLRQLDDLQAPSVAPKLESCEPQNDSTDSSVRASSNCGALTVRRIDLLVGLVVFQQQPVAHPGAVLKVPVIAAGLVLSLRGRAFQLSPVGLSSSVAESQ